MENTEGLKPVAGQTDRRIEFLRCATCGKYITPSERVEKRYCSAECGQRFLRCANCGRYYTPDQGFSERNCSRECAARYAIRRAYGPAELGIRTEEIV